MCLSNEPGLVLVKRDYETLILSDMLASTQPKKPSFCVTPPFQFRPFSPDDFWAAKREGDLSAMRERKREGIAPSCERPTL